MIDKLKLVENRFAELGELIIQPDIISDQKRYIQISKEYKDIKKIIDSYNKIDSQEKLILTTEKDATRLALFENYFKGIDIVYLPIEFKFQGKTNFNELILKYVEQNRVDSKVSRA